MLFSAHSRVVDEAHAHAGRRRDAIAQVAAHDDDVVDAGGRQRVELPVQDGPPAHRDHALRDVGGLGAQPPAAARGDDDRLHRCAPQLARDPQHRARGVGGVHRHVDVQEQVDPVGDGHEQNVARIVDDESPDGFEDGQRRRRAAGAWLWKPSP